MDIETFTKMVAQHDLTYMYSDDGRVSSAGSAAKQKIIEAAKELDNPTLVKSIWDAQVDRKLLEGYRKDFYW